jgi:PAS domain S-box-containing protein
MNDKDKTKEQLITELDELRNRISTLDTSKSDRKKAGKDLRDNEQRFRQFFDNQPSYCYMISSEGTILNVNKAALKALGYKKDQVVGMPLSIIYAPESMPKAKQLFEKWKETGSLKDEEMTIISKDGNRRVVLLSSDTARDKAGEGVHSVSLQRGITERNRMEEERQEIAKLESVGVLAGGIAHDFNNLLTGIVGYIGLAKSSVAAGEREKASARLLEAEKTCLEAAALTLQLLTFARGGAPVKKTVSIAGLIEDVASFALRGSNVRCEFSLPDNLWAVEADEGQIRQVITNLIINAGEAMPEGGTVNIQARNSALKTDSVLPLSQGRYVEIVVEDHGIGIAQEHLNKIFDPYFTTKQKGSGLGLSTTYSIIAKHDGRITVESELGIGTTFHIYLPASKKRISRRREVVVDHIVVGQGKILVMDDEKNIREIVKTILTGEGYDVEIASDGAAAVKRYIKAKESGQPFGMVILDLTVPGGMGGLETIKELLKIDPDVKAIASSGYSSDLVMSKYRKYGFSGVLGKPYVIRELTKAVDKVLQAKKKIILKSIPIFGQAGLGESGEVTRYLVE